MIEPILDGSADLVLGSRLLGGRRGRPGHAALEYMGNRLLTSIENLVFGLRLAEYHTGYGRFGGRSWSA